MSLIDCEINLILTWSGKYIISERNGEIISAMIDQELYEELEQIKMIHTTATIAMRIQTHNWLEYISIKSNTTGTQSIFGLINWSKFSGSKYIFFIIWT